MTAAIDIDKTIAEVEALVAADDNLSPALRASIKMLIIMVVKLLTNSAGLNNRNSSKPPSSDPNREKTPRTKGRKPGGQAGHKGSTLTPLDDPDEIKILKIDRRTLPQGDYREMGYESRQSVDIRICRHVTEYRAETLVDATGKKFVADFPAGLRRPVQQYGAQVKANAVYMSMYQLIPFERVKTHFDEMFDLPLSAGSLFNFNLDAFNRLTPFIELAKWQLSQHEAVIHADETSININAKRFWLHGASNERWTLLAAHAKRGKDAMDDIGILPNFTGYLIHDHWKPYYRYEDCQHGLCNAHHKRELTRAYEQDDQAWAKAMERLLDDLNEAVKAAGGRLPPDKSNEWRVKYRSVLAQGNKESPPPTADPDAPKKGRLARSKSRNLLERLRDYEADVLRFMDTKEVPYTNNQGERDIRMSKVQQKISGCFRSPQGAEIFCAVRSYLSTCLKHQVGVGEALEHLFAGTWPDFIQARMEVMALGGE